MALIYKEGFFLSLIVVNIKTTIILEIIRLTFEGCKTNTFLKFYYVSIFTSGLTVTVGGSTVAQLDSVCLYEGTDVEVL